MAKIYLLNVGANVGHSRKARSPIFSDDTWKYVSFPRENSDESGQDYPSEAIPFVHVKPGIKTHLDPDWKRLTYGDCCDNPRAGALKKVNKGDILLFWALLWGTTDAASIFKSHDKGWYLIGALRVKYIFESGEKVSEHARRNAHVKNGRVEARKGVRVFVGSQHLSQCFTKAIDLEIGNDKGLMRQIVKAKDGRQIEWDHKPHWNSVTRSCRAILDLKESDDRKIAKMLATRIKKKNKDYNLLAEIEHS